jgi:hypothetical protein
MLETPGEWILKTTAYIDPTPDTIFIDDIGDYPYILFYKYYPKCLLSDPRHFDWRLFDFYTLGKRNLNKIRSKFMWVST